MDDCGASVGEPTPTGKPSPMVMSFSLTICLALKISVPHSNSTQMVEKPTAVEERTRRTSAAPLTAVSMGNVTRVSTSSLAIPCASVSTVTVGAVKSGKTSIGSWIAVITPLTRKNRVPTRTTSLYLRERFISFENIASPLKFSSGTRIRFYQRFNSVSERARWAQHLSEMPALPDKPLK